MIMEKDLSNIRQHFQKNALLEENTADNPMELFRDWYLEAENEEPGEAKQTDTDGDKRSDRLHL